MGIPQWLFNIGSGNGLLTPGNNPLREPILPQIPAIVWHHKAPNKLKLINWGTYPEMGFDQETVSSINFQIGNNEITVNSLM